MEGLVDDLLRDVLTRVGGYDLAVSEFIRVSGSLLPVRSFLRTCPELAREGRTAAGTPVVVQLLGSDPACLADNAARLARSRRRGSTSTSAVRRQRSIATAAARRCSPIPSDFFASSRRSDERFPAAIPFTAKMRLGVPRYLAHARLCAGARSRRHRRAGGACADPAEGYRPPAHWEWVARIDDVVQQPVAANGEVWTATDHPVAACVSGCRRRDDRPRSGGRSFSCRADSSLAGRRGQSRRSLARLAVELQPLLAAYWQQVCARVAPRTGAGAAQALAGGAAAELRRSRRAVPRRFARLRAVDEVSPAARGSTLCRRLRAVTRCSMPADSRLPISRQTAVHQQLPRLLDRHSRTPFRKPCADYNQVAFADSFERYQRLAGGAQLILDSGCGVGESTVALARAFPDHYVIGVDQSAVRLARARSSVAGWPDNLDLVRADLVDYWRLLHDAGGRLDRHYLLYPNPWPKMCHVGRRWHGHAVFPTMLALAGVLECRSNWPIYLRELSFALQRMTRKSARCEAHLPDRPMTAFERKYLASGHALFRVAVDLT
jgi:tRNA (guanine-N7-)-methyltransferase